MNYKAVFLTTKFINNQIFAQDEQRLATPKLHNKRRQKHTSYNINTNTNTTPSRAKINTNKNKSPNSNCE